MSDVREGYKITELGEVPLEWDSSTLGASCLIIMGQSPKGDSYNSDKVGLPLLNGPTEFGLKHPTPVQWTSEPTKISEIGDILFTVRGSSIGRMNIADRTYCIGRGLAAIRQSNRTVTEFINYILQLNLQRVLKNIAGSTFPNITKEELHGFSLVLPSIEEQQKIALILSTVDKQIDETEQLIVKTKELKKGLMQQLLTKGIGHTEFKKTEYGEIPIDWDLMKLSEISEFITKGSTPTTYGFDWEDEGIYFFKSDVVKEGKFVYGDYKYISKEAHKQMTRSIVKAGDILISITGNVGRVAIVPQEIEEANINQHIARIRVNRANINAQFIFQWLNQSKIIKYYELIKTGLAYPQISLAQVRDTLIPIPSSEEQQKIAQILSTVDEQIEVYEQEKVKYEELKKGLMQQLLTGQIRVKI